MGDSSDESWWFAILSTPLYDMQYDGMLVSSNNVLVGNGSSGNGLMLVGGVPDDSTGLGAPPVPEILLMTSANLICLVGMYYRRRIKRLRFIPEQVLSIVVGVMLGIITALTGYEELSETILYNFSGIFFEFFLPAIIFSKAYTIKHRQFFRNLSGILLFSVFGTILSSVFIGLGVFGASRMGMITLIKSSHDAFTNSTGLLLPPHEAHLGGRMPLVDCLILGCLLSAVDPGAIYSILPAHANKQVSGLLFGESVLNSAIAVVLYNGFRLYHNVLVQRGGDMNNMYLEDIRMLSYRFVVVTSLSAMVGVFIGLVSAFVLKTMDMKDHPGREQAIMILFAYISYLGPRQLGLSPVVSIFLCGATMSHYTFYNISRMSQIATATWFRTVGHVAETFVFVFLGASLSSVSESEWRPDLIFLLVSLCLLSRFFQIMFLSAVLNFFRWIWSHKASWLHWPLCNCVRYLYQRSTHSEDDEHHHYYAGSELLPAPPATRPPANYITLREQIFLSWSGLRGAVAFALALHAPVLNAEGQMLTTTVSVILFTFLMQGCSALAIGRSMGLVPPVEEEKRRAHERERRKLLQGISNIDSPSVILRLGGSPHKGNPFNFKYLDRSNDDVRSDDEDEEENQETPEVHENSYGTFTRAWRNFDEKVMKKYFGGSRRPSMHPALEENRAYQNGYQSTEGTGEVPAAMNEQK